MGWSKGDLGRQGWKVGERVTGGGGAPGVTSLTFGGTGMALSAQWRRMWKWICQRRRRTHTFAGG